MVTGIKACMEFVHVGTGGNMWLVTADMSILSRARERVFACATVSACHYC